MRPGSQRLLKQEEEQSCMQGGHAILTEGQGLHHASHDKPTRQVKTSPNNVQTQAWTEGQQTADLSTLHLNLRTASSSNRGHSSHDKVQEHTGPVLGSF